MSNYEHKPGRYAPHPMGSYMGDRPSIITRLPQWNLAFLSHPYEKLPLHKDPKFEVLVVRTARTRMSNGDEDVVGEHDDTLETLLSLPAPQFLKVFKSLPLKKFEYPMYKAYGQQWLDTMEQRSWLCIGHDTPPDNVSPTSATLALLEGIFRGHAA